MITFLMILFILVCIILALFVLVQQGKGDMGLGSLNNSTQTLFGGSGGQEFFEKATWILGALFIFGSLGLTILKSHAAQSSRLAGYRPAASSEEKAATTSSNSEKTPLTNSSSTAS